jgi:hypothetical protein
MQPRFTFRDGIALTGMKAGKPQWWNERGLVPPGWERHRRLHTTRHLRQVARHLGIAVQRIFAAGGAERNALSLARERGQTLAETVARSSQYYLLTDGTHLYIQSSARGIVDTLKNSNQPILAICLTDASRQVRARIASRKANTSVTSPDHRKRARKAS